ncbi:DUF3558 domain-containing protein [Mycobacterium sp. NPDC050853]|uniref:DUF3558 domain-containing protein n=1 Tax=Mycobacterium sp. NPDC050853 TaxID=3155160 RepID=UPI0033E39591
MVALSAGCNSAVDGQPLSAISKTTGSNTSSSAPTVTNTLPGPHPPPNQFTDGTSFDPCFAYSSSEIESWGVSPSNVVDVGADNELVRGCRWRGDGWNVSQLVANRTVSEFLAYPDAKSTEIGGLQGAVYWNPPGTRERCEVVLPSQRAVVSTGVHVLDSKAERTVPDLCQKAIDIAAQTAPRLPR